MTKTEFNERQREGCVQASMKLAEATAALMVFAGHDVINLFVAVAAAKSTIAGLQKLVDECEQRLAEAARTR